MTQISSTARRQVVDRPRTRRAPSSDESLAVPSPAPAGSPSPGRGRSVARAAVLALLLTGVGTAIAFVRFRVSPWYPPLNDVNSDLYVFQMVGNSWLAGFLPYRDVYDVKGPFLYLLFAGFAWLRPWSMALPLAFLAVLASTSVWISYAIARRFRLLRPVAAVAAVTSSVAVYLGVADVNTSFTCEEIAVPGVLLMLWLVLRLLDTELVDGAGRASGTGGPRVPAAWWVVDGAVFGALFWTKYQVISPWAAVFLGLVVLTLAGRLPARSLRRVAGWNALGLLAATAAIVPWYAAVLPEMAKAYFLGKRGNVDLQGELPAQAAWFVRTVTENTGAALVLAGVLAVFVVAAVRTRSPRWALLTLGLTLSLWASASFVRHPNHLFVPLAFTVVAVSWLLAKAQTALRPWLALVTAGALVATAALLVAPLAEAGHGMWLFGRPRSMTCRDFGTGAVTREREQVTTAFARAAQDQPILSLDTLFAARTSFVSHQPVRHPYAFVDHSWAWTTGATSVQTRYLRDHTFAYVWVHVDDLQASDDVARTLEEAGAAKGGLRPDQAAVLVADYTPVLGCSNELLLRAP